MSRTDSHFARPLTQSCEHCQQPLRLNLWPLVVLAYCLTFWACILALVL